MPSWMGDPRSVNVPPVVGAVPAPSAAASSQGHAGMCGLPMTARPKEEPQDLPQEPPAPQEESESPNPQLVEQVRKMYPHKKSLAAVTPELSANFLNMVSITPGRVKKLDFQAGSMDALTYLRHVYPSKSVTQWSKNLLLLGSPMK